MKNIEYSEQAVHTLSTGDVALLKDEPWEGNKGADFVQRSPAVNARQKRLLLTLDFVCVDCVKTSAHQY
ncbi:hypothetical protein MAH1_32370 [Sessilibacter sp. MAH1]